jgi:hypothetical protein
MAFNPFHKFRKHQKVIFAALTILCMVTFVLCTGIGDLGSMIQRWIVGSVRQTDMYELYDSQVGLRELAQLQREREIANLFMAQATSLALQSRLEELRSPGSRPDDFKALMELTRKAERDPEVMQLQARLNNQPYFGGSWKPDGLMDFKIWLHQADLLGIRLSKADIQKEVARLTHGRLTRRESGAIEGGIAQKYKDGFSSDVLMAALANEFRARMAQVALVGLEPSTLSRMPAPITPEEFWGFFKENQTRIEVRLMPVKAEDFLDKVTDKPTEKELKDLFTKGQNQEYLPEAKDPGFKQARRVQVEWVAAKWDSPFYKKAVENYRNLLQGTQQIAAGLGNRPAFGTLSSAINAQFFASVDTQLLAEYEQSKWPRFVAASYTKAWRWPPFPLQDSNLNTPRNIAAAVGQTWLSVHAGAGGPTALGGYSTFLGNATLRELDARTSRGATWVLSSVSPAPAPTLITPLALGTYLTPQSEFLPLSLVKDQVKERLQLVLAQDLMATNLKAVQKEIEARAKKEIETKAKLEDKTKKELEEYLAKAVKDYELRTGKTTEPRDVFKNKIGDDAGLAPLKEAYLRPPSLDREGKRYADMFFSNKPVYAVERFPSSPFRGPEDDLDWKSAPESFLWWKLEDQPAKRVSLDQPEVRKEVERAWKLQKARELAKKEAEKLAIESRETRGDVRKLMDLALLRGKDLIVLPPMSKLMQQPSFRPEAAYIYDLPRIPDDKVPYAGREFANKLLVLKEKEKGDTTVVADQPEGVFYVAVLVDRREPSLDEFFRVYKDAAADSVRRDPLMMIYEQERQVQYFKDVMEQLRLEAKLMPHKENL